MLDICFLIKSLSLLEYENGNRVGFPFFVVVHNTRYDGVDISLVCRESARAYSISSKCWKSLHDVQSPPHSKPASVKSLKQRSSWSIL